MIERLDCVAEGTQIEADIAIAGAGACGLTLARELAGSGMRVVLLESGKVDETPEHEALNVVETDQQTWSSAERSARNEFHGEITKNWSGETQSFGVRCRGLGGSTHAWAGKSAAFDKIDFEKRDWVPHSGWPFSYSHLKPFIERAGERLNLGPNCYDEGLWDLMGVKPPEPTISQNAFSSFFWQFSRGRVNPMDTMRFGAEFVAEDHAGVQVLLNATVLKIQTSDSGTEFKGLEVSTLDGKRINVHAKHGILAAGAIENARLLLLSKDVRPEGLGNRHDQVGRYLTDHLMTTLGRFTAEQASSVSHRFGFYGLRHEKRSHMYAHGLQLATNAQRSEGLLNASVFFLESRKEDDPFSALARLLKRRSKAPWSDLGLILRQPVQITKGIAMRVLESDRMPSGMRKFIVENALRRFPNQTVREYRFRGLPRKLDGVIVHGISEQAPDPENRVMLSEKTDALGQPIARVIWRSGDQARRTMLRMGELMNDSFSEAGLPVPTAASWLSENRPSDAPLIDSGHTMGTTRMSETPEEGVVDPNCKVHGIDRLFVAGGSVMPTTGHANPTLMMTALAIRLADHLKQLSAGEADAHGRSESLEATD